MSFQHVEGLVKWLNGIFFSDTTIYILLVTGLLFTVVSFFGQYRALTHGLSVIRGKYDDKDDPGAINHFQALSAALSATVGLGNIGGVAAAVAVGGPGAVFWMWVIGVLGMALKMTEVIQSMLYRNTDDPDNPHGGPMFVVKKGFERIGLARVGSVFGGIFCCTLILSAITGGNMFQSWNVAEVTTQYTPVARPVIGVVLAVIVGAVIIGGIRRIGAVAGRIVPFMCGVYVLAALAVLATKVPELPALMWMIVEHGLGMAPEAEPGGAFLGASLGVAFAYGVKRALFSSEAGQGSAPIAHSAAKTDEPVREGVVAGLEPFIDTIVVCTMTALVILSTGAYNRGPEAPLDGPVPFERAVVTAVRDAGGTSLITGRLVETTEDALVIRRAFDLGTGNEWPTVTVPVADIDTEELERYRRSERERVSAINASLAELGAPPMDLSGLDGRWAVEVPDTWMPALESLPPRSERAERVSGKWRDGDDVLLLAERVTVGEGRETVRVLGKVVERERAGQTERAIRWSVVRGVRGPALVDTASQPAGLYGHYVGAGLTAHAFDRAFVGVSLGKWLIIAASWLFAVSTMISWSYYGEQGIIFLFGDRKPVILAYKFIYCVLVFVSCLPFIRTEEQLDMWTALGLGAMLIANIPIMLLFGLDAMKSYHGYMKRLRSGELDETSHRPASFGDIVSGRDVRRDD